MFSGATFSNPFTTSTGLLFLTDDNCAAQFVSHVYPRLTAETGHDESQSPTFPVEQFQRKSGRGYDARTAPKSLGYMKKLFADAQLDLGKQMFRAGIDENDLILRIAQLDEEIKLRQAGGASLDALQVERDLLYRRLADAALAYDAPLPGAQSEFDRAQEALRTLQKATAQSKNAVKAFRYSRMKQQGDQFNAMTV